MAKKKSGAKTNAARILDGLGVPYELKEYPVDPDDLSAVHVAEMVGMPVEQVFKTLVARGDKTGVLMACIPGLERAGSSFRQQARRDGAPERGAGIDRLCARRLLAAGREKSLSCFPRCQRGKAIDNLDQRGKARRTDSARARRFDPRGKRRRGEIESSCVAIVPYS